MKEKFLPLDSEEREKKLAEILDKVDHLTDTGNIKALGQLQAYIQHIRPRASDTQIVLEVCSKARKALVKLRMNKG